MFDFKITRTRFQAILNLTGIESDWDVSHIEVRATVVKVWANDDVYVLNHSAIEREANKINGIDEYEWEVLPTSKLRGTWLTLELKNERTCERQTIRQHRGTRNFFTVGGKARVLHGRALAKH